MLLDSNIIIYAIKPEFDKIREFISQYNPSVSAISYVEVLGYHQLTAEDKQDLTDFFEAAELLTVSKSILERATSLRQQRKMSLGDSIIAATALVYELTLVTANTKDFKWIDSLEMLNPLEEAADPTPPEPS